MTDWRAQSIQAGRQLRRQAGYQYLLIPPGLQTALHRRHQSLDETARSLDAR